MFYFQGLVKARKVLSADYGTVHLHFGSAVSLRDFCQGSINRAEYALFPRYACLLNMRLDQNGGALIA